MTAPNAMSAEPIEYHAGNGRIAYVRQVSDAGGGMFMFYARPGSRPDLVGRRIKRAMGGEHTPIFTDYHEAQEALAVYAKQRGWKRVAG
jgi:hypothetical protein